MGKMRFFKQNLTVLFVSVILVIMAACGGKNNTDAGTTPTKAISATPTAVLTPTATPTSTHTLTPTNTNTPTPTPDYTVADMEETVYVSLDSLNVRRGPSTKYNIIGKLQKGERVIVSGEASTGWYRVEYEGEEAFVSNDYVMPETEYVVQFPTPTPDPRNSLDQSITEYAAFTGGAFAVIDVLTGEILYSENGDKAMYPASLTKMMTGLLACEKLDFSRVIPLPEVAGRWQYETSFIEAGRVNEVISGDFSGVLKEYGMDNSMTTLSDAHSKFAGGSYVVPFGTEFTVDEMVHLLMLMSAADMADALAYTMGDESLDDFNVLMNAKAEELGMKNTYFDNAVGADDLGDVGLDLKKQNLYYRELGKITTTANDLALLANACMRNQLMRDVVCTSEYTLTGRAGLPDLKLKSSVLPVASPETYNSPYFTAVGIKTGFTNWAGNCLALAGRNSKGRELVVIYLKNNDSSNSRINTAKQSLRLLEYAFRKMEQ